jgi:putative transposase
MLRAYKFRAYPSQKQIIRFEKTLGICCFLYNSALQERKYAHEARRSLKCYDQIKELPELKKTLPEYGAEVQILKNCQMDQILRSTVQLLDHYQPAG